jgi:hypothetical protein
VFLLHTNEGYGAVASRALLAYTLVCSFHEFWARTVPAIVGPTFGRATRYSSLQAPDSMVREIPAAS